MVRGQKFSTALYAQMEGQLERTIWLLEDLPRSCVLDWQDSWEDYVPFVEPVVDNSNQFTIGMSTFKAQNDKPCRSPPCWLDKRDLVLVELEIVEETEKRDLVHSRIQKTLNQELVPEIRYCSMEILNKYK